MEWKKNSLLGVESMMASEGSFKGLSEKATNFTKQFLENCFNRFSDIQPLFLSHDGERIPMGYITSLGMDESKNTLHFKGIVFDEDRKQRVLHEGFDCISPEIELLSGTPEDPVDGRIVGGAFTRHPAIPGTKVNKCVLAFSSLKDDANQEMDMETTTMPEDPKTEPTISNNSSTSAPAYNPAEVELAKIQLKEQIDSYKNSISTLTTERDSYKNELETFKQNLTTYKEKYETLLGSEVSKLEADLTALGVEKPGEFAPELDVETRLEVLKSAKANLAKSSKLNAPPTGTIEQNASQDTRQETARKVGIPEKYLKFIK